MRETDRHIQTHIYIHANRHVIIITKSHEIKGRNMKKTLRETDRQRETQRERAKHVIIIAPLYCIVLYLYIYIALLAVHTNQKCFQCQRPREKRAVLMFDTLPIHLLKSGHLL